MKQSNGRRLSFMLIVVASMIIMVGKSVKADFTFGEPENLSSPPNSNYHDLTPSITSDGLEMFFWSNRSGGHGSWDLWSSTRRSLDHQWLPATNLGSRINTSGIEALPCVSADGLELYFSLGSSSSGELMVSRRNDRTADWSSPQSLGSVVNSSVRDDSPALTSDSLELYFISNRAGGHGLSDIWVTRRPTINDDWDSPVNVSIVNSTSYDQWVNVSGDGLTLLFQSDRPGGEYGGMYMSRRRSKDDSWTAPVYLGLPMKGSVYTLLSSVSADGKMFYLSDHVNYPPRVGGFGNADMWQVPIDPIVDFNGDGFIDTDDLLILIDNWQTDNSLCDIGLMPWGDGVVDMNDLTVFIEYWEKENFINVVEDDNGSQVTLKNGQRLVVTLESNPSTGYSWQLVEDPNSILEQIGESKYIAPEPTDPPMVGVPGWEIFRFKAVSAGQETLNLVYRQPWETDVEPIKTFSIEVTVN